MSHETVQHGSSQAQLQAVDTRPRQALCKKRVVSKEVNDKPSNLKFEKFSFVSGPGQHDTSKTRHKDDNGKSHMLGQATSQAGNTTCHGFISSLPFSLLSVFGGFSLFCKSQEPSKCHQRSCGKPTLLHGQHPRQDK